MSVLPFLTAHEAAERLGVDVGMILLAVERGILPAVVVGGVVEVPTMCIDSLRTDTPA